MSLSSSLLRRVYRSVSVVLTAVWLINLAATDSYFSIYVLVAFVSLWLRAGRWPEEIQYKEGTRLCTILSVGFSVLVLLANYQIFLPAATADYNYSTSVIRSLINIPLTFFGGICAARPIVGYFFARFPMESPGGPAYLQARWLPWAAFGVMLAVNLVHLFLVEYPGTLTEDTMAQIGEMVTGSYSNFNTFYHTMIFQVVLTLGYGLFGDVNAAAAFFCTVQCVILCAAFVCCLMTLRDYGVSAPFLAAVWAVYTFIPYNIALSIAVWKDVLFAAGCLFVLTAWLRIMKGLGRPAGNYIVFGLGSVLFLLSRSVGWVLYLLMFAAALLFSRRCRKLLVLMGIFAVSGWLLLNPVLDLLNIPGADKIEILNLPIQQVSRVIVEECPLTPEEETLLSRVIDLDQVSTHYTSGISDPMKVALREKDPEFFDSHISEFMMLWLRLGLRFPAQYLKAWIDLTKGYWNGGYFYFLWAEYVCENPYGIITAEQSNPIASLFRLYFNATRHVVFFQPLYSIGLHVWMMVICFFINFRKKREQAILSVPMLGLILGLIFGTPVYTLFRYVYPLFVCFPLLLAVTMYDERGAAA